MKLIGVPLAPGTATGQASLRWDVPEPETRVFVVGSPPVPHPSRGPAAWVLRDRVPPESRTGGAPPAVGGVDTTLIEEGDRLRVDGGSGLVELEGVVETPVITAFLTRSDGRVLLLRRSEKVGSFQGLWAGVSGFLEDPTAEEQAFREVEEETGIDRTVARLVRSGSEIRVRAGRRCFVVHPFRFDVGRPTVRLDWEHTEARWVDPEEIGRLPSVPRLREAWQAVAGPAPPSTSQRLFLPGP